MSNSNSHQPPPISRPIRRRNPSPPAASGAKLSSSSIPSLSAVRRTLFHSSSASRLAARAGPTQPATTGAESRTNGPSTAALKPWEPEAGNAQVRKEEEELVARDNQGNVVMEGVVNMATFPRDERTEEESEYERSLISDMYRQWQSGYGTDYLDLQALLQNSLQDKVNSLQEDAWMFGHEEEVPEELVP